MSSSGTSSGNLGASPLSNGVLTYTVDYWGYHSMMSQDERQHGELSQILNRALLDRNNALDVWVYARLRIPLHPLVHICRWNLIEFLDPLLHAISEAGWSLDSICKVYELMIVIAGGSCHSKMLQTLLPRHKTMSLHLQEACKEVADDHHVKTASSLLTHSKSIRPEYLPAVTKFAERSHLDTVNDLSKRSLLYTAVAQGQEHIARLLLQHGETVDPLEWTPRTIAPINDKIAMMNLLGNKGCHILGMLDFVLPGSRTIRKSGTGFLLEGGTDVRFLSEEHPMWFFHTWRYDERKSILLLLYLVWKSRGLAGESPLMYETDNAIRARIQRIFQDL